MPPRRTPPRQQTRGTRTGTHRRQTDTHLSHANTGRGERISEMVLRHPASFQSRRRFLRCSFRGAQSARHVSRRATTTRSAIASAASVSTLPPPVPRSLGSPAFAKVVRRFRREKAASVAYWSPPFYVLGSSVPLSPFGFCPRPAYGGFVGPLFPPIGCLRASFTFDVYIAFVRYVSSVCYLYVHVCLEERL